MIVFKKQDEYNEINIYRDSLSSPVTIEINFPTSEDSYCFYLEDYELDELIKFLKDTKKESEVSS